MFTDKFALLLYSRSNGVPLFFAHAEPPQRWLSEWLSTHTVLPHLRMKACGLLHRPGLPQLFTWDLRVLVCIFIAFSQLLLSGHFSLVSMNPKTGPMFPLESCVAEAGKGKQGMEESHGEIPQVLWQDGPKGAPSYVCLMYKDLLMDGLTC